MEDILIAILNRIKEKVPGLSFIDEDTGQLEGGENTYPLTFPCVLIGNMDSQWKNTGNGAQQGETQFTVRLIIDCYDDTHIGSGTTDRIRERLALSNGVYKALQYFRVNMLMSPLVRLRSRDYTFSGGIKVYEKVFKFDFFDESARPT